MIRPPGFTGAAFGTAESGDLRVDRRRRESVARDLGISVDWAFVHQIHSAVVVTAHRSGRIGDADAIITNSAGVPGAIATADCVPIVVEANGAAAVIHAGWRGAAAGVVPAALDALQNAGHEPLRAAIGPAIGPCCYEVGPEVAEQFPGHVSRTSWDSISIDIPGYLEQQLAGLEVWRSNECTFTSDRLHSWRRDHTKRRQVTVAWLPNG